MKNILPKIIVIIAAMIFWLLIVAGQNYVVVTDIPLKVYEPRPDMTLGKVLPENVNVRVEGPGHILYFQRWSKNSSLVLDVGAVNNDQRISLKSYFEQHPNQVVLQPEVTFLEIVYPDSIDIQVEKKISKEVPVKIMYDISVKAGYILVDKPVQTYVSITGPEDYIESIDHVRTETLKKENVDVSFQEEITVINPKDQLINIEPGKIGVSFEVQMIGERIIHNIPVRLRNPPADLKVQFIPEVISLRITGGNSEIQDLTKNDFSVYFDYLAQWFPNKNYYSVNIDPPEEVLDIINVNPEKIEVVAIKNRK